MEELLDLHRDREEALLQRVHMQFGVRDFGGEVAVDDLYEHERYSYFSFSWGSSYPGAHTYHVSMWKPSQLMMVLLAFRTFAADGSPSMERPARLSIQPDTRQDRAASARELVLGERLGGRPLVPQLRR